MNSWVPHLTHVGDHTSGHRDEVRESDLEHPRLRAVYMTQSKPREEGAGEGAVIAVDLHLIASPCVVEEIGLQDRGHEEREHHLHHEQQDGGPGERRHAAADGGHHQVERVVLLQDAHEAHHAAELHQAEEPEHHGVDGQVIGARDGLQVPHLGAERHKK